MVYHDAAAEAEAHYDRLDDLGQFDATTIREMTGYETDGSNEDFTAEAIAARSGSVALHDTVEHPHLNQKGGLSHVGWSKSNQDPEQAAINHTGLQKAREALEAARHGEK